MQKFIFIVATLVLCCSDVRADVFEPIEPQDKAAKPSQINGAKLYQDKCAQCHGELAETRIPDRRPGRIASAIKHFGVMANLKHLTAMEIIAISEALASEDNSLTVR